MKIKKITPISSPHVSKIPIIECNENLVDLRAQKVIHYAKKPAHSNEDEYAKLRETVYLKLMEAQSFLPKGLFFSILEGYRSLNIQEKLFKDRFESLQNIYPTWNAKKLFNEVVKLVSPIVEWDGKQNVPPHSTGGAFDIILVNEISEPVFMGIHPADASKDVSGALCATESIFISCEAAAYREIMCSILFDAGFVNYPTEYWHWSYGDRYHAYHMGLPHAVYGNIDNIIIN